MSCMFRDVEFTIHDRHIDEVASDMQQGGVARVITIQSLVPAQWRVSIVQVVNTTSLFVSNIKVYILHVVIQWCFEKKHKHNLKLQYILNMFN